MIYPIPCTPSSIIYYPPVYIRDTGRSGKQHHHLPQSPSIPPSVALTSLPSHPFLPSPSNNPNDARNPPRARQDQQPRPQALRRLDGLVPLPRRRHRALPRPEGREVIPRAAAQQAVGRVEQEEARREQEQVERCAC